jgi:hypothetical protein
MRVSSVIHYLLSKTIGKATLLHEVYQPCGAISADAPAIRIKVTNNVIDLMRILC